MSKQINNVNVSVFGGDNRNVNPPTPNHTPPTTEGFERYLIGVIGPNIRDSVECEIAPGLFLELERKTISEEPEPYEGEGDIPAPTEPTYDLILKNTSALVTCQGFHYSNPYSSVSISQATLNVDSNSVIRSNLNLRYNHVNHLSLEINGDLYDIKYVLSGDDGKIHISSVKIRNIG